MKLLSLKLLNFRRFKQEEIIFRDDFSLIFWKNGSWKSSVLDAVWYAIFGPSSKDFVRVNRSFLKSHFLSDRESSKLELTFQYWLDSYRIVRVIDAWIKKFASDFIVESKDILFWPNWLEIIGWDEVTNYITKLLWISRDIFLRSVFAKQKDLEVLSWSKEDRKNLINSILWLDKIENIIIEFKKEEKEKKVLLEILKKRVWEFDLETLKNLQSQKENSIKDILILLKSKENEIVKLYSDFEKIKQIFEIEDKKKENFNIFKNNINLKESKIINLNSQNENINLELQKIAKKESYLKENEIIIETEKKLQEKLKTEEQNKILFNESIKLKIQNENYTKELEKLSTFLINLSWNDLLKQIEVLEIELKKIEENFDKKIKSKIEFESKREIILWQYSELKTELENIKKLDDKADCPTCKRPLQEHFPNLVKLYEENINTKILDWKNIRNEIDKLNIEIDIVKKEILNQKNKIEELKLKEKEFIKYSQDKINLEKNISLLKEKLQEVWEKKFDENKFSKLKIEYQEVKKNYLEYLKIQWEVRNKPKLQEDLKLNTLNISIFTKELENLKLDLEKLGYEEKYYLEIKQNYFNLNSQIKTKQDELQALNKEKLTIDFELKNILKKLDDFNLDKKEIEKLVLDINYIWLKKEILSDYIIYLLNHLKPNVEELSSDYFYTITDWKYSYITLDEDYNIMIDEKNIDLYSWWERDLANLCLRLSLGQNLSNINWNNINFLILDEVLASQDKDRQQNILLNLKKLEHKFSQIILISHLEDIKEMVSSLIEIKQKDIYESEVVYY